MAGRDLSVVGEFEAVDLGDARHNARALSIVARLQEAPADSFPDQMADDAESSMEALRATHWPSKRRRSFATSM